MRQPLGPLTAVLVVAVLVLGGCGDDALETYVDDSATTAPSDPPDPGDASPTPSPGESGGAAGSGGDGDGDAAEAVDHDVVALPFATAAGGTASAMLTPVDSPDELETFVSQFERDELAEEVRTAATTTSYDGDLWAGVVSVGCDVPPGVTVSEGEAGYLATPQKVVDPLDNCVAPVTTVALVAIR
jgi:hypothetical protein